MVNYICNVPDCNNCTQKRSIFKLTKQNAETTFPQLIKLFGLSDTITVIKICEWHYPENLKHTYKKTNGDVHRKVLKKECKDIMPTLNMPASNSAPVNVIIQTTANNSELGMKVRESIGNVLKNLEKDKLKFVVTFVENDNTVINISDNVHQISTKSISQHSSTIKSNDDFVKLLESVQQKTLKIPKKCTIDEARSNFIRFVWKDELECIQKEVCLNDMLIFEMKDTGTEAQLTMKSGITIDQLQNLLMQVDNGYIKQKANERNRIK